MEKQKQRQIRPPEVDPDRAIRIARIIGSKALSASEILRALRAEGVVIRTSSFRSILLDVPGLAQTDECVPRFFFPDWKEAEAFAEEERRRFIEADLRGEPFAPREFVPRVLIKKEKRRAKK